MHLYDPAPRIGESQHASYPPKPDPTFFDTDFGVRFGMHTCFDMAFRTPGAALALDYGISDFVFPTGWVTRAPPMMPATEMQQGWSRAVGVNLLAADGGESWGSSGSGIYSRGHVLAQEYSPFAAPVIKLLVATLPKLGRPTPNLQASESNWAFKTEPLPRSWLSADVLTDVSTTELVNAPVAKTRTPNLGTTQFTPLLAGSVSASANAHFRCLRSPTAGSPSATQRKREGVLTSNWAWIDFNSHFLRLQVPTELHTPPGAY